MGQKLAFSPIILALYLLTFLHILEKQLKNLKIPISFLSFVDDRLLIAQSKSCLLSNSLLFCYYNVASNILSNFGLIVEHSKTKIFISFDLLSIGGPTLCPKETWKYLSFIFDRKLLFHQHIDFYSNKSISIVKYMKILGNSVHGLNSHQKCFLYKSYILLIVLYRFQL